MGIFKKSGVGIDAISINKKISKIVWMHVWINHTYYNGGF